MFLNKYRARTSWKNYERILGRETKFAKLLPFSFSYYPIYNYGHRSPFFVSSGEKIEVKAFSKKGFSFPRGCSKLEQRINERPYADIDRAAISPRGVSLRNLSRTNCDSFNQGFITIESTFITVIISLYVGPRSFASEQTGFVKASRSRGA